MLHGRDDRIAIRLTGTPIPLLEEDYRRLEQEHPTYDMVGRGVYQLLRTNPDCNNAGIYADLLKEAYPHFLAEMATEAVMLDKKEVDYAYLDRKINYLKIFSLVEPHNGELVFEIGSIYMDKGLSFSALHMSTRNLYAAEKYLLRALALVPEDLAVNLKRAELSYLLGRYEEAAGCWSRVLPRLGAAEQEAISRRVREIGEGRVPKVPPVDYLEAIGGALSLHQQGEYEESAAILLDVLDDEIFSRQFPMPEIPHILGLCAVRMGMPRHAEEYFRAALEMKPDYPEAAAALKDVSGRS